MSSSEAGPNPYVNHPKWLEFTDEYVLTLLLTDVEQPDTRPVYLVDLKIGDRAIPEKLYDELQISFLDVELLRQSSDDKARIMAKEIGDLQTAMATVGFTLHTPERQALLVAMAGPIGWSDELLDALKRVGVPVRRQWQLEGLLEEPSLEALADWRAERVEELAEQAAAAARLKAYETLRGQVQAIYGNALRTLNEAQSSDVAPPTIAELFGVAD